MNIKLIGSSLFLVFILSGCSTGNHISYSSEAYDKADMTFIGMPTILGVGLTGSTFPISKHYSLTAKHVAKYTFNTVVAYHPFCDVAIIKKDNTKIKKQPIISQAYYDEEVDNFGYSFISAMPISSTGEVKTRLLMDKYRYGTSECPVLFSTNGAVPGMSGGPVYNKRNEIVGVNIASYKGRFLYAEPDKRVKTKNFEPNNINSGLLFVHVFEIKEWITDVINKTEDKGTLIFK